MTEQTPDHSPTPHAGSTGNETVDAVLESLEQLDGLPAAEHVAVYEAAHDRLRGALSDAGDESRG